MDSNLEMARLRWILSAKRLYMPRQEIPGGLYKAVTRMHQTQEPDISWLTPAKPI